jgi:hypothetical protein
MKTFKFASLLLTACILVSCWRGEDGHADLGGGLVLMRNSSRDVRVVDWQGTNEIREVVSVATNANLIIAVTLRSSGQSNYWVVNRAQRSFEGPYDHSQYISNVTSDSMYSNLNIRGIWTFK